MRGHQCYVAALVPNKQASSYWTQFLRHQTDLAFHPNANPDPCESKIYQTLHHVKGVDIPCRQLSWPGSWATRTRPALGRDMQNGSRAVVRSRAARDERSVIQTVLAGSRDERSVIQTVPRDIYFSSEGSSKEQGCQGWEFSYTDSPTRLIYFRSEGSS